MRAGLRQSEPARRESVPFQEKSGEREGVGKIGCRQGCVLVAKETRQSHQLVAIGLTRGARDRAARPRRYESEILLGAGRGAGRKIESETELRQKIELKARDHRRRRMRIAEPLKDWLQSIVNGGMRFALGEQPA